MNKNKISLKEINIENELFDCDDNEFSNFDAFYNYFE